MELKTTVTLILTRKEYDEMCCLYGKLGELADTLRGAPGNADEQSRWLSRVAEGLEEILNSSFVEVEYSPD